MYDETYVGSTWPLLLTPVAGSSSYQCIERMPHSCDKPGQHAVVCKPMISILLLISMFRVSEFLSIENHRRIGSGYVDAFIYFLYSDTLHHGLWLFDNLIDLQWNEQPGMYACWHAILLVSCTSLAIMLQHHVCVAAVNLTWDRRNLQHGGAAAFYRLCCGWMPCTGRTTRDASWGCFHIYSTWGASGQ